MAKFTHKCNVETKAAIAAKEYCKKHKLKMYMFVNEAIEAFLTNPTELKYHKTGMQRTSVAYSMAVHRKLAVYCAINQYALTNIIYNSILNKLNEKK